MYNYAHSKTILLIATILIIIGIILSLASCSIAKKTEKAYENVASLSPLTNKDTANFYKRAKTIIKTPKPVVIPSKTIKVPYPVDKIIKQLDTATARKLSDSITAVFKAYEKYNEEDCSRQVKEAIETGYRQAKYEDYINGKDSVTPEIQIIPDTSLIIEANNCQVEKRNLQDQLIAVTTERNIYKGSSKSRLWLIILLSSGLLVSIYLHFKKPTSLLNLFKKSTV